MVERNAVTPSQRKALVVVPVLFLALGLAACSADTSLTGRGRSSGSGTSAPTPGPTGPNSPDPKAVSLSSLLRPGTVADRVLYSDLNGDGVKEIILSSHAKARTAIGGLQPFLDVWSFTGQQFQRVFDATIFTPGVKGAPDALISSSQDVASQEVSWLDVVDFEDDGAPELVAGITGFGASVGPMDVWVLSMGGNGFRAEFWEETTQDGTLTRSGRTEKLDTPFFGPNDPLCCPSKTEHQVIGFNNADGKIEVLEETFTKP
jgi:hypothetical protein